MVLNFERRSNMILWQLLFIVLSTTWLLAPHLNHLLSYRTALISQYEVSSQAYSWLFRLGDIAGASLLLLMARSYLKNFKFKFVGYLLLIIGAGMLLDAVLGTSCTMTGDVCIENSSGTFVLHAAETVITSFAFFVIGAYDVWLRRRLVSIAFIIFQVGYLGLFLSQLADQNHFNTFSQFLYQTILVVWTAWFCRDFIIDRQETAPSKKEIRVVRLVMASWAFINGLTAILISLADLDLLGRLKGLYFAGDNAWLAQHGVVIGVVMIYLSRQLARGELRARQIFLFIVGLEVLKYSVITPHPLLMVLYLASFAVLFVLRDEFARGAVVTTVRIRMRDALFMVGSLLFASFLILIVLYRSNRLSYITASSIDNFFDYVASSKIVAKNHLASALLAHTFSAFLLTSIGTILWILFRPSKTLELGQANYQKIQNYLNKYSNSSEDYFKLWPKDKQYFWGQNNEGFIAYKVVGPIAFALADPIGDKTAKAKLIKDFITWAKARRLRACFLPIYQESLSMYEKAGLNSLQIGASAVLNTDEFLNTTAAKDKWWRWQKNRAVKSGYSYFLAEPPHAHQFIAELRKVSAAWLSTGGHHERGFAMGYYDEQYLQNCRIHYLKDEDDRVIAFTNQLPVLRSSKSATVDLLRYLPEVDGAMPYLLFKTIEELKNQDKYAYFDLGFVPFTTSKDPVIRITKALSGGKFSARGLEQFKNKFNPEWQPNYLAYDGDLADLALMAINIEKLMAIKQGHGD